MTFACRLQGWFILGNEHSTSACDQLPNGFEEMEDITQTGNARLGDVLNPHHCSRLVAFQPLTLVTFIVYGFGR